MSILTLTATLPFLQKVLINPLRVDNLSSSSQILAKGMLQEDQIPSLTGNLGRFIQCCHQMYAYVSGLGVELKRNDSRIIEISLEIGAEHTRVYFTRCGEHYVLEASQFDRPIRTISPFFQTIDDANTHTALRL